ncbi:MAG: thiamine diphosphokinase [Coriobacteriales bacterium]|jgi:thiamine pyrophosphokinase|nr:thiamine diphosphokinase [Coriobacteriales bacterium]
MQKTSQPQKKTPDNGALLVSGSPVGVSPDLLHDLAAAAEFILALDSGGDQLAAAGLLPDLLLGDLDSLSQNTLTYFEKNDVPVQAFDSYKNATDLELGIEELSARGYQRIVATNIAGGRTDHMLGSLGALAHAAGEKGMQVAYRDNREACFFVSGAQNTETKVLELEFQKGDLVAIESFEAGQVSKLQPPFFSLAAPAHISLIAWGGPATVSLRGTEWELDHHTLSPSSALAVSNVARCPKLRLEVHGTGTVLLLLTQQARP